VARPVKPRTGRSYARDVEALVRLRAAIMLDPSIREGKIDEATAQIDALVSTLRGLIRKAA
jgi:hypothetical protein